MLPILGGRSNACPALHAKLSSDKGPQLLERTRVYLSHMRLFEGKVWKRLAGLVTLIGGMVWVTGCGKLVAPVDTYGFVQAFSGVAEEGNEEPSETPFQAHRTHWCSPFSRRLMQVSGRRHAHISKPCVSRMTSIHANGWKPNPCTLP